MIPSGPSSVLSASIIVLSQSVLFSSVSKTYVKNKEGKNDADMLAMVPVLKLKKLMTVDREEMEGYRSIRNLVSEYYNRRAQEPKPISIAVFGPPGSGKSFGVKQIAGSIQGLQAETITYNLSQFNAPDELARAFIKSRDISLQGKLPIIFFEFDSDFQGVLEWLKYS